MSAKQYEEFFKDKEYSKHEEFWAKWSNLVKALDAAVLPLQEEYKELVEYLQENQEDVVVNDRIHPHMKEVDTLFALFNKKIDSKLVDVEPNLILEDV